MENCWRQKIRVTWLGLSNLTFGAGIMLLAISNAEHSIWSLPQFAFGGAIVTQGFLHLTAAWNIPPPADNPHPLGNGIVRVGVPLAPAEEGVPDLAVEGLILHRNSSPIADPRLGDKINDLGKEDPVNADEVQPSDVVGEACQANFVGDGQVSVPEIIVDEADQEIDDSEVDPANALGEVGQVNNAGESDQVNNVGESDQVNEADESDHANNAGESGQAKNAGELGQNTDESEPANVVNESRLLKDVGEVDLESVVNVEGQANDIGEENQADSLDDIAKCADKDDSTDSFESEIELPRSFIGLTLDVPSIKFIDSSESECESS